MKALRTVRNITIFAAICAIVFLVVYLIYENTFENASDYTEAQHIERVTDLAKKRYLKEDSKYTDLKVYPMYTENEKLGFFLIELEPAGYIYIFLNHDSKLNNLNKGMYIRSTTRILPWARYEIKNGNKSYLKIEDTKYEFNDRSWSELDENDMPVLHQTSHFKTADIKDEKRYFLKYNGRYIPAVKRNDKFLNLISMNYMNINYNDEINQPTADFVQLVLESSLKL